MYRIGVGDNIPLTDVTSVGFDDDGNLVIGDFTGRGGLSILVIDPDGSLVTRFGRRGEGPGEFRGTVVQAYPLGDGRVAVPDDGHRAYHIFASDGEFDRMVRMADKAGANPMLEGGETEELVAIRQGDLLSRITTMTKADFDQATFSITLSSTEGPAGGAACPVERSRHHLRDDHSGLDTSRSGTHNSARHRQFGAGR